MKQRGRKSGAALVAVPDLTGRRPALVAPASLTAGERQVWARVVERVPIGWFAPEMLDLVVQYVGHVCESQRLRKAARADDLELGEFGKLSDMARRESTLALAYARALRLTPQARMASVSAARRAGGPRPSRGIEALFEERGDD
jgi:hypothetical protein